jgi:hypothetical protein
MTRPAMHTIGSQSLSYIEFNMVILQIIILTSLYL